MLIPSPRHTAADLAHWARVSAKDALWGRQPAMLRRRRAAVETLRRFAAEGPCYAGLSCGKDSTVLMGLLRELARAHGVVVPVAYVRVNPHENPDNALVLEAVRAACPELTVDVIEVTAERDPETGAWVGRGRLEAGFREADRRYGARHISGIRASESALRTQVAAWHGVTSAASCRPMLHWRGSDVFAYLAEQELPVHPAYACTFGGTLDRERIRVATLGGDRGIGHGRRGWELYYYRAEMFALGFDRYG